MLFGHVFRRTPLAAESGHISPYGLRLHASSYWRGFCEEACPVDAIVETRIHEYHMEAPGENILTKDKLLAIGDKYDAMISADKAADAKYR